MKRVVMAPLMKAGLERTFFKKLMLVLTPRTRNSLSDRFSLAAASSCVRPLAVTCALHHPHAVSCTREKKGARCGCAALADLDEQRVVVRRDDRAGKARGAVEADTHALARPKHVDATCRRSKVHA